MKPTHILLAMAAPVLALALAEPVAAADGPRIVANDRGEGQVIFPNDCTVAFNSEGEHHQSSEQCRPRQIERADEAMASYRRQQGIDLKPPRVKVHPAGAADVRFGNGCTMEYDRTGVRKSESGCSQEQFQRADEAVASARTEKGFKNGPDQGFIGPLPPVRVARDGAPTVEFDDGCKVHYDSTYRLIGGETGCRDEQIKRSHNVITEYRRQKGL